MGAHRLERGMTQFKWLIALAIALAFVFVFPLRAAALEETVQPAELLMVAPEGAPEEGSMEASAAEEPAVEEPAAEEPVAEQPVTEEPVAAEPTAESPVTEAPGTQAQTMSLTAAATTTDPTGLNETEETYSVPSGSAYIKEIGDDIVYTNDTTDNAIQSAIKDAITYALATEGKTATIVVKDGVYQNGITIDNSAGSDLAAYILSLLGSGGSAEDISITIAAEDALNESGNPTTASAGNAQVEGNITIDGLNVVLAGLYLSTRGVITARNTDEFAYYGTKQDDELTLQLSHITDRIQLDAGEGDDTLNVNITQAPSVAVSLSPELAQSLSNLAPLNGLDAESLAAALAQIQQLASAVNSTMVTVNLDKTLTANISGGAGNDTIRTQLVNSTDLSLAIAATGAQFQFDLSRTLLNILGGAGSDDIGVTGAMSLPYGRAMLADALAYFNVPGSLQKSELILDGGAGDDVLTVDTTSAFSSFRNVQVTMDGGEGYDRLHLTGKLNTAVAEDARITGDSNALNINALAELTFLGGTALEIVIPYTKQFVLSVGNAEAITDQLLNKRTVNITETALNAVALPFTNYSFTPGANGSVSYTATRYAADFLPGGNTFLTNFVVDGESIELLGLYAPGFTVLINGKRITVTGTVTGKHILLLAVGEDPIVIEASQSVVEDDLDDETSSTEDNDLTIGFKLCEAAGEVKVTISSGAALNASGLVELLAQLTMDEGYIPTDLINFEPFLLKFGTATVEILGNITAGGSVRARSLLNMTAEATNGILKVIVPIAVAGVKADSSVTVGGDARITAGSGMQLTADTHVKASTYAVAGAPKISISLAFVEANTFLRVNGNAALSALKNIDLKANSIIDVSAIATGKPANILDLKPKSGGFLAVSLVFQDTAAEITGNASVSTNGALNLLSNSVQRNKTISVSIPASDKTTQIKMMKAYKLYNKILEVENQSNPSAFSKTLSNVTSNPLGTKVDNATQAAKPASGGGSATQVMGSLSVAYLENTNLARISTTNTIRSANLLRVRAFGSTVSELRADGSLYKTPPLVPVSGEGGTPEQTPTNAVGVGIAVSIVKSSNKAEITAGNITAGGLSVIADAGYTASSAIAKSGHIPPSANFGLGGAITVHIVNVTNSALVGNGANYTLTGGGVTADARARGEFVTVADASGKRATSSISLGVLTLPLSPTNPSPDGSVGIGAGIAVGVVGIDVTAIIQDGAAFHLPEGVALDNVLVNASFTGTELTHAAAGAKGGTSIAPVLALDVSGVYVEAYLGTASLPIKATGDVLVNASNTIIRTLKADAAAVGNGVGVGAAFGVSILNDSSTAWLKRSARGRNVQVNASSVSRMTQTIKASAVGAPPSSSTSAPGSTGGTQQEIDNLNNSGSTGTSDDDPLDPDGEVMRNLFKEGEADKLADKNTAAATNMAGSVNSKNVNCTSVGALSANRPKAQTSEGSIQVAAGLALNIHSNKSYAGLGDGLIIAAVPVSGEGGAVVVRSKEDTDSVITANASATNSTTGVGVAVAINKVSYSNTAYLGDSRVAGASLTVEADIYEAVEKKSVEEILTRLIAFLADMQGMELLLDVLADTAQDGKDFDALMADALGANNNAANQAAVKDAVTKVLVGKLTNGQTVEVANGLLQGVIESLAKQFIGILSDPSFILQTLITGSPDFEQFFNEVALISKVSAARIRAAVTQALSSKFGSGSELTGVGSAISTTAISGVGAANVGIAGSAAIAVVDGVTRAIIAGATSSLPEDTQLQEPYL